MRIILALILSALASQARAECLHLYDDPNWRSMIVCEHGQGLYNVEHIAVSSEDMVLVAPRDHSEDNETLARRVCDKTRSRFGGLDFIWVGIVTLESRVRANDWIQWRYDYRMHCPGVEWAPTY